MIKLAKELNLEFKKNEHRKQLIINKFNQRRKFLAQGKQHDFVQYTNTMYVDPVSLYLFLTFKYWQRIEKRSVKTMSFYIDQHTIIDKDSVLLDEMFEKVIKHFAKHQIKMNVKEHKYQNEINGWTISLKTLEL